MGGRLSSTRPLDFTVPAEACVSPVTTGSLEQHQHGKPPSQNLLTKAHMKGMKPKLTSAEKQAEAFAGYNSKIDKFIRP